MFLKSAANRLFEKNDIEVQSRFSLEGYENLLREH